MHFPAYGMALRHEVHPRSLGFFLGLWIVPCTAGFVCTNFLLLSRTTKRSIIRRACWLWQLRSADRVASPTWGTAHMGSPCVAPPAGNCGTDKVGMTRLPWPSIISHLRGSDAEVIELSATHSGCSASFSQALAVQVRTCLRSRLLRLPGLRGHRPRRHHAGGEPAWGAEGAGLAAGTGGAQRLVAVAGYERQRVGGGHGGRGGAGGSSPQG